MWFCSSTALSAFTSIAPTAWFQRMSLAITFQPRPEHHRTALRRGGEVFDRQPAHGDAGRAGLDRGRRLRHLHRVPGRVAAEVDRVRRVVGVEGAVEQPCRASPPGSGACCPGRAARPGSRCSPCCPRTARSARTPGQGSRGHPVAVVRRPLGQPDRSREYGARSLASTWFAFGWIVSVIRCRPAVKQNVVPVGASSTTVRGVLGGRDRDAGAGRRQRRPGGGRCRRPAGEWRTDRRAAGRGSGRSGRRPARRARQGGDGGGKGAAATIARTAVAVFIERSLRWHR